MNEDAGELAGLTQEDAEKRILDWIKERGLLVKRESYRHSVALCERCATRIEPLISLQWWCSMEELKKPALEALGTRRVQYHPESQHRFATRLARERARLEHLAPDLVGAPDPRLGVPGRARDRADDRTGRVRRVRVDRADPQRGRARHVVLVGALAVRDPRLARADAGARDVVSRATLNTTAREIIRLWENPDDLLRPGDDGRDPVPRRDLHTTVLAPGRAADVEEPRHRPRPARTCRRARRRLDPLRPAEDVVVPGRPLRDRRDRGGAQAREQALERRAASCSARRPPRRRSSPLGRSRGTLDPRPPRRRPVPRSTPIPEPSSSRTPSTGSTT